MEPCGRLLLSFPVYGMKVLEGGELAVVGGGGRMKSGVSNGCEVHSFDESKHEFSKRSSLALPDAATALTTHGNLLVALIGTGCKNFLYNGKGKKLTEESDFEHDIHISSTEEQSTLKFSNDGKYLIVASDVGPVRVLRYPEYDLLATNRIHSEGVNDVAISSDNRIVGSSARDKSAYLWNINTGDSVQLLQPVLKDQFQTTIKAIRFSPIHPLELFAVESNSKKGGSWISAWKHHDGSKTPWRCESFTQAFKDSISTFSINDDGNLIALASVEGHVALLSWNGSKFRILWNTEKRTSPFRPAKPFHALPVTSLCFTKSNEYVFSASADWTVVAWPVHKPFSFNSTFKWISGFMSIIVLAISVLVAVYSSDEDIRSYQSSALNYCSSNGPCSTLLKKIPVVRSYPSKANVYCSANEVCTTLRNNLYQFRDSVYRSPILGTKEGETNEHMVNKVYSRIVNGINNLKSDYFPSEGQTANEEEGRDNLGDLIRKADEGLGTAEKNEDKNEDRTVKTRKPSIDIEIEEKGRTKEDEVKTMDPISKPEDSFNDIEMERKSAISKGGDKSEGVPAVGDTIEKKETIDAGIGMKDDEINETKESSIADEIESIVAMSKGEDTTEIDLKKDSSIDNEVAIDEGESTSGINLKKDSSTDNEVETKEVTDKGAAIELKKDSSMDNEVGPKEAIDKGESTSGIDLKKDSSTDNEVETKEAINKGESTSGIDLKRDSSTDNEVETKEAINKGEDMNGSDAMESKEAMGGGDGKEDSSIDDEIERKVKMKKGKDKKEEDRSGDSGGDFGVSDDNEKKILMGGVSEGKGDAIYEDAEPSGDRDVEKKEAMKGVEVMNEKESDALNEVTRNEGKERKEKGIDQVGGKDSMMKEGAIDEVAEDSKERRLGEEKGEKDEDRKIGRGRLWFTNVCVDE